VGDRLLIMVRLKRLCTIKREATPTGEVSRTAGEGRRSEGWEERGYCRILHSTITNHPSHPRFAKNVKQARQNNSKNNSAAKLKKMRAQAMKRGNSLQRLHSKRVVLHGSAKQIQQIK
jgi:hypothetical protein